MKKSPKIWAAGQLTLICGAACLCHAPAFAAAGAPEILVLADLDNPASETDGNTRSLERTDLEAQAPVSLLESLNLLPGIDAFEKGGIGSGSYLSLRGGEPNFTLVLVNGVRVNDPMQSAGGGFDFSLIGPGTATRVDVLSGPWSTIYGADALSGVVSLRFGVDEPGSGLSASMGTGSGGRFNIAGRAFLSGQAGSLAIAGSAQDTAGFHAGSSSAGQSAMLAASPAISDAVKLDLFGFYGASQSEGFPEDSGGPLLAANRDLETRDREQLALGASATAQMGHALTGQLRANWGRSQLQSSSPGIAPGALDGVPPIDADSRFDRMELVSSLDWLVGPSFRASMGGSLVHERGRSDGMVDFGIAIPTSFRIDRTLPGLFATGALTLPGGPKLRGGLRLDFPGKGPARFTPRMGIVWPVGDSGFQIAANFAQGFKQPSLFALGFPLLANPALKPEKSTTYDGSIGWQTSDKKWLASLTAFRSVYRDLIDFDPESFTNINRQRVTTKGLEFAAQANFERLRLLANFTYLSARSIDDSPLRFRPKWKGSAAVQWQASDRVQLRLDGRYNGKFLDSSVPTGFVPLNSFVTVNAQLRIELREGLALRAALRNLADTRYFRTIGTSEPGRNVFISLNASI